MSYVISEKGEKMLEEQSFKIFKHAGFVCCVQRMGFNGVLNGYVGVPKESAAYGAHYYQTDDEGGYVKGPLDDIDVHGGITFTNNGLSGIEDGLLGDLWWIGFDCSHLNDVSPIVSERLGRFSNEGQYRDMEYVTNQTKQLAEQLQAIAK